jgi:hypothetical protein
LSGKSFDFFWRIVSWVEADTTLGTTVWNTNSGTLEGHETSEGLDFMDVDVFGVSGSTLGGKFISFVLASVGGDDFDGSIVLIVKKVPLVRVRLNLTTLSAFL